VSDAALTGREGVAGEGERFPSVFGVLAWLGCEHCVKISRVKNRKTL
jgi:hypothetical protein